MAEKQRIVERITNVRDIQTSPLDRAYAFLLRIVGYLLIAILVGAYFFFKFLWENIEIVIAVVIIGTGVYFFLKKKGYLKKKKKEETNFIEEIEQPTETKKTVLNTPPMDVHKEEQEMKRKNTYTRDYDSWRPQYDG